MLPIEVVVPSLRFFKQNGLTPQEYSEAMMMELESTDDIRIQGISSFSPTYGQDAMLPIEVVVPSLRFFKQNGLTPQEYSEAMMMELESTDDIRIQAFNYMFIHKNKVD